jgi:low affinity Fe/Cu permease
MIVSASVAVFAVALVGMWVWTGRRKKYSHLRKTRR